MGEVSREPRERAKKNAIIAQHTKRIRDRKKAGSISAAELELADIHLKALRRKAKPWSEKRVSFIASVRDRLWIFELPPFNIKPEFLDSIAKIAGDEFDAHSQQRKAVKARHKKAALQK
jgi:hypothetical protein